MKKYSMILCLTSLLIAATRTENYYRIPMTAWHDTNQVEICVSNYGTFGQDGIGNNPGCFWPQGTNHTYIFGAGIWFGTIDPITGDTLVTIGYGPHGGECEFAPGLAGWSINHPAAIIYINPENWPPPPDTLPMAPQEVVSHEDSWCCFNDCDSAYHVPGDTRPIGIEVYQTVYAWDTPCVQDIIFFTYEAKNVSGHVLNECYFGVCADCDIGNETGGNDRCAGILERAYIVNGDTIIVDDVIYQWQEEECPGTPPWFPGTIGFDLLQTPFDLVAGMDKDNDGIPDQYERDSVYYVNNLPSSMWDVDNDGVPDWRDPSQWPQMHVSALKRFTLGFEPMSDPERYAVMAGYNFVSGQYEPFDTIPDDPDDQRFIMASGPFSLAPDSIVTMIFAIMFADWHEIYMTPDSALVLVDQQAEDYYNMFWYLYTGIEENFELRIPNCEMKIAPNPVSRTGAISFSLPVATDISLKLYNITGQLVEELFAGRAEQGYHAVPFATEDLPQGTYFLVLNAGDLTASRTVVVLK